MRTYEAIEKVSEAMIEDALCEAILIKGSIGRGDDDEYSDIDMYAVVKEVDKTKFLEKRLCYLNQYMPIVYSSEAYFVTEQIVGIYENGLHIDLYTVTEDTFLHTDKAKIIYDPYKKFENYTWEIKRITKEELVKLFQNVLYSFVEADSAYGRKNYPWAARIMNHAIADSSVLLRYLYDKDYAFLALKKINEIIPKEQYEWIATAYDNLKKDGFQTANEHIIKILDFVVNNIEDEIKERFDYQFFDWMKKSLNTILFV